MLHEAQATSSTSSGEKLTELYRLYSAEAFRFAVHLTGRKEDAEDVLQQVFLQAHRHLESGAELVNPRAWLMIAVKHRVFNLQRGRRELPSAEVEPGLSYAGPSDEAAELTAVRGILWTLPEKQHQAFVLRYWSGLSQSEIAQVLGTTAGAVESLLVRARTVLISERANGSEECQRVRMRLVEGGQLSDRNNQHLRSCNRCRAGHLRLSRVAEFAGVVALVPSLHVAHGLAASVPGFTAPAASLSLASAPAAGVSTVASASTAASAVTASSKLAVAVKVALAVAATTAAVTAVPSVHSAVDRTLFPRHTATLAAGPAARAAAPAVTGVKGAGPGAVSGTPAASGGGSAAAGAPGSSGGKAVGQGNGKAVGKGHGKAVGQGNGKATGQGNGKAVGQGNGKAKGKATGAANGKGNGSANGKAKGAANGNTAGAANGKANGKTKSTSTGQANGNANGAANGNANGAANGNSSGNANGASTGNAGGNGKAKGNTKGTT